MSLAYKQRISTIESWPMPELIRVIEIDKRECIGPERLEYVLAGIGMIAGRAQGMNIDIYDLLTMNLWSKVEREPMSDAAMAAALGCKWNEENQRYE